MSKDAKRATDASFSRGAPHRIHGPTHAGPGASAEVMLGLQARAGNHAVSSLFGGEPLDPGLRREMESRFGADFSTVRIHDDEPAHASAAALRAKAFTDGEHIAFSDRRYEPRSVRGRQLLAHELAHVIQQRRGSLPRAAPSPTPALESAADVAAGAMAQGTGPIAVAGTAAPGVARKEEDDDYEDEDEVRRRERQQKRQRDRNRTQGRQDDQRYARGGLQGTAGPAQARRELDAMLEAAESGRLVQLSPDEKLARLRRFKDLLKAVDMPQLRKNQLQGQYDELLRTSSRNRVGKPQTKWVAGGEQLPFMDLPAGEASYAQPDVTKRNRRATGKDDPQRLHVNLKSDTLEGLTPSKARDKGRRYLAQAKKNMRHLPTGDAIVIDFAEPASPAVRQEILGQLFKKGSPVREVRFHTSTVRADDAEAKAAVQKEEQRATAARKAAAASKRAKAKPGKAGGAAGKGKAPQSAQPVKPARQTKAPRPVQAAAAGGPKAGLPPPQAGKSRSTRATRGTAGPAAAPSAMPAAQATDVQTAAPKRVRRPKAAPAAVPPKPAAADAQEAVPATGAKPAKRPSSRKGIKPAPKAPVPAQDAALNAQAANAPAALQPQTAGAQVKTTRGKQPAASQQPQAEAPEAKTEPDPAAARQRRVPAPRAQRPPESPGPERTGQAGEPVAVAPSKPRRSPAQVPAQAEDKKSPTRKPAPKTPVAQTDATPPVHAAAPGQPMSPAKKPMKAPVDTGPGGAKNPARPRVTAGQPDKGPGATSAVPQGPLKSTSTRMTPAISPRTGGVGANFVRQSSREHGQGVTSTRTLGFGGNVWVETTEIPYRSPKRYRVVFHLRADAQAGASVGKQGSRGAVSAGVGGQAAIEYSVAHEMAEADMKRYLAQVGSGDTRGHTELQAASLTMSGDIAGARTLLGIAEGQGGNPWTGMKEGEERALEASGSVHGHVSASAGRGPNSVGVHGGANLQGEFEKRVKLVGGKYVVTVTSSRSAGTSYGAQGSYFGVGGGIDRSDSAYGSNDVVVVIDPATPKSQEAMAEINAATSVQAVRNVQAKYGLSAQTTTVQGQRSSTSPSVSLLGLELSLIDEGDLSVQHTDAPEGRTTVHRGSGTGGGQIKAGDTPIYSASSTNTFVGGAGPDNVGFGDTANVRRETDYAATAKNALARVVGAGPEQPGKTDVAAPPIVKEDVHQQGAALTDDSYATLIELAKSDSKWSSAWSGSFGTWQAWMATLPKVRRAGQDRAAVAQALAEFESESGRGRSETVQKAIGASGIAFEFPQSLAHLKPLYERLIVYNPIGAAYAAGDGPATLAALNTARDELKGLRSDLIDKAAQFESPASHIEMMQRIRARTAEVNTEIGRLTQPKPQPTAPADKASAAAPLVPAQAADAPSDAAPVIDIAAKKQEIDGLVGEMQGYKKMEAVAFAVIEAELDAFFGPSLPKIFEQENKLRAAYPKWDKDVKDLRRLIGETGGDASIVTPLLPDRNRWLQLDRRVPFHSYGAGLPGFEEI